MRLHINLGMQKLFKKVIPESKSLSLVKELVKVVHTLTHRYYKIGQGL